MKNIAERVHDAAEVVASEFQSKAPDDGAPVVPTGPPSSYRSRSSN